MIIKGTLITNQKNLYGYETKVEDLIVTAEQSKGMPLYSHHEPWKKSIGIIVDTKIVYRDDLDCLAVEADIEIHDSENVEEVINLLKTGGFSGTYSDGGFVVDESDGKCLPHLIIYFDAYRTNETKLYLEAIELSKSLNIGVECARVRRHGAGAVLAFVGTTIGAYFLGKILDDMKAYDSFKKFLINTSKSSESGKEVNINVIAPSDTKDNCNRMSYHIIGQDDDINSAFDYIKENRVIQREVDSFTNTNKDKSQVYYEVKRENGQIVVKKTKTIDRQSKIDYFS